jgi:hypothetical protein
MSICKHNLVMKYLWSTPELVRTYVIAWYGRSAECHRPIRLEVWIKWPSPIGLLSTTYQIITYVRDTKFRRREMWYFSNIWSCHQVKKTLWSSASVTSLSMVDKTELTVLIDCSDEECWIQSGVVEYLLLAVSMVTVFSVTSPLPPLHHTNKKSAPHPFYP